jgi:hypothetical protein
MASAPDVREQAVTLGLGASSSRYSVRGDVRLGRRNDAATAERRAVTQCTVYASYRPTRANAFTLYAGSGSGGVASSRLLPGGNNLGVAALWTLSKQTRLDLAYLRYGGVNGGQFDLRFSYGQRRDRPSWELQVRRSESGLGGQSETAYVISYTRPFGVPVGKKRSLGGIAGTVYDAQDPDRRGLPGVVLRANGALVTTDPRGRFAFPDLAPGAYPVTASLEAAGLSRVSVTKLPLIVEVKPGESAAIEIAVTEGARLSGTVTVGRATPAPGQENGYVIGGPEGENAPAVGAGLRDIVVELSQGDEVLRRATDASGRFLFADLRPGRWHLKVYDWNLPAFHQVENAERDPELKPGESQELRINVTPRRRRIRLMESESGVTVPEPAATSAPSR